MKANEIIKWAKVSVILTGNKDTVRSDRVNAKHTEKIDALLEYIQNWIDKKGEVGEVKVTITAPVKIKNQITDVETFEVPVVVQSKKIDYVSVDSLPKDRKLMSEDGYRGLYSSGKYFYTNKVKDGGLDIREWKDLKKAKLYLESLK